MNGLSFFLVFGAWARPMVYVRRWGVRVCLGWVALGAVFYDLEVEMNRRMELAQAATKKVRA